MTTTAEAQAFSLSVYPALCDSRFRQGVLDKLAGRPPQDGSLLYQHGQLFAAFCHAINETIPELPRRGQHSRQHQHLIGLVARAIEQGVFARG
ncbi:MAG: hypothetical protein JO110_14255 [Acetobacteraceae bacterium]|nr:hypothetical protein [Acetobacteraceae bacterium]